MLPKGDELAQKSQQCLHVKVQPDNNDLPALDGLFVHHTLGDFVDSTESRITSAFVKEDGTNAGIFLSQGKWFVYREPTEQADASVAEFLETVCKSDLEAVAQLQGEGTSAKTAFEGKGIEVSECNLERSKLG